MIERAELDKITVIYSHETLDPLNPNHYMCDIEPSAAGGEVIAKKIAQAIKDPAHLHDSILRGES